MNLGQNPQILLFLFLNASLKARDQKQIYRLNETVQCRKYTSTKQPKPDIVADSFFWAENQIYWGDIPTELISGLRSNLSFLKNWETQDFLLRYLLQLFAVIVFLSWRYPLWLNNHIKAIIICIHRVPIIFNSQLIKSFSDFLYLHCVYNTAKVSWLLLYACLASTIRKYFVYLSARREWKWI